MNWQQRMQQRIADRVGALTFSGIRSVVEAAEKLEREGVRVIHLELGRPDFITPEHIRAAAKKALDDGLVHYTPNRGLLRLREAICEKLERENGIRVDPYNEILVTVGAVEGLFLAMATLLNPGDELLVLSPYFPHYVEIARFLGARPVLVPLRESGEWTLGIEEVQNSISPRTRVILVNSPHNPTGCVLGREVIEKVADVAVRHDLVVVSDEVYEKFVYDGAEHISLARIPGMQERTVTVNAFSKTYSMTGWRLGYVAAPAPIIQAMTKLHQYTVTSATSFAQAGAVAAFEESQECVARMLSEYERRRRLVYQGLSAIPGIRCAVPRGGFYVFFRVGDDLSDDVEMAKVLLTEAHVAVVPGSVFGPHGRGHIRLSYAAAYEDLEEALRRMEPVLRTRLAGS